MKITTVIPAMVRSTVCTMAIVALASALCAPSVAGEQKHTKDSLDKVKKLLDEEKALLIDVREKKEWDAGHVEGALLISLSGLRSDVEDQNYLEALDKKLSKKIPLYVHCRSGGRCLIASKILAELGYEVRPLKPGFQELIDSGFPRAKPEKD